MSINNVLDSDVVIPVIMVGLFLVIIGIIIVAIVKRKNISYNPYGTGAYAPTTYNPIPVKVEINAKIIARRTTPLPNYPSIMNNKVVFEFTSGNRVELLILDSNTFGTMVEGDQGTLKYQGTKFISFERNNSSET